MQYKGNEKEYHRQYYLRNKDKLLKRAKEWGDQHVEEKREKERQRYLRKRKKIIEKTTEYYFKNKKKVRVYRMLHRKRKVSEMKSKLNEVFGSSCAICNSTKHLCLHEKYGIHHTCDIYSAPKYYLEHPNNFIRVCYVCHKAIHYFAKLTVEELQRFLELIKILRGRNDG